MSYRDHPPIGPALFGYDPAQDVPQDHLARLVDEVVDAAIQLPRRVGIRGNRPYDPRVGLKVLLLGYALGIRSSRVLEEMCRDRLSFKLLTRGETPSYRTLCHVRVRHRDLLEQVFVALFAVADRAGIQRCGRIKVDSHKVPANASPEAVIRKNEFADLLIEFERILKEAEEVDAREDDEGDGPPTRTSLGKTVETEQVRDIVRRVRKQMSRSKQSSESADASECRTVTSKTLARIRDGKAALERAKAEGKAFVCLTDPDAQMMSGCRPRKNQECYSFEAAVDNGLLVASGATQATSDNSRLTPLVEAARQNEPEGIIEVTADSGFYAGDAVAELEKAGIQTCVPDANTSGAARRGRFIQPRFEGGSVVFVYDDAADCYRCPQGNELKRLQSRRHGGQQLSKYRAIRDCTGCPLVSGCLKQPGARRRTFNIGQNHMLLEDLRRRFNSDAHWALYRQRAPAVETVFGVLKGTLGFTRWMLRGQRAVSCEAWLFTLAYQLRKVHRQWVPAT